MAPGRLLTTSLLIAGCAPFAVAALSGAEGSAVSLLIWFALSWLPVACITADLAAVIPVAGGPYAWGRVAYGSGWGFSWGWWRALAAIFDVALVGAVCSSLGADVGAALGIPGVIIAPASVVVIGAAMAAWPPLVWLFAVAGAVAVPIAFALAPTVAPFGSGAPELAAIASSGLFGGVFAMRGADVVGLVAGGIANPRRTIAWATVVASAVIAVGVVAPAVFEVGSWPIVYDVSGTLGEVPLLGAVVVGLAARAAIGVSVASRLVGAMAVDRYLPEALALRADARPSRHAVTLVTVVAGIASMLGVMDVVAGLTATWVASLLSLVGAIVVIRIGKPPRLGGHRQAAFTIPDGVEAVALCGAVAAVGAAGAVVEGVLGIGARWVSVAAICLATGPAAWVALTIVVKRGRPNRPIPLGVAPRWFDPSTPGTPELASPVVADGSFEARVKASLPVVPRRDATA